MFRNKAAYPVYLTLGNIPKEIRQRPSCRAQVLLAYLPANRLESMTNKAARRRALANLFHACTSRILSPLEVAGITGIMMASGDGAVRRTHPLLAACVMDYPEQLMCTCCKNGECPKCEAENGELGERGPFPLRDLETILHALDTVEEGPIIFNKACKDAGLKPVYKPFWQNLPYTNIFLSITPDVLHQLYQGLIKHLTAWLTAVMGSHEIDARCRRMPPNHSLRLFSKGKTMLSRVSGTEHRHICRILLGLIIGVRLPNGLSSARLVCAVRGMLDFIYIAQYPIQTTETLLEMTAALDRFHANKAIFVDLGIRQNFNLPKLHSLVHYPNSFELFGTYDNTNTEYTERLHIDLAKDAYCATNKKDEYPQMTRWLERKEKIDSHTKYLQWRLSGKADIATPSLPRMERSTQVVMTKHPSVRSCKLDTLCDQYGAVDMRHALAEFIVRYTKPELSRPQQRTAASIILFQFHKLPVWHRMKFITSDPHPQGLRPSLLDSVHVQPARLDSQGRETPGRFDTVLVKNGDGSDVGLEGMLPCISIQYKC